MVVGRDYLLKQQAGPGTAKRLLDTWAIPRAVNSAGAVEVALNRASARTGVRPGLLLMAGAGVMSAMAYRLLSKRRRIATEPGR